MALNGIQIFKLTPKKNCKECGCPTCMAFSMKVAQGAMKIEQCPHMSDEALASLSEQVWYPVHYLCSEHCLSVVYSSKCRGNTLKGLF